MDAQEYSKKQVGWVIIAAVGGAVVAMVVISLLTKEFVWVVPVVAAILLLLAFINFSTLTVKVDSERVRLHFGPGLIRKSFLLSDLVSSRVVTNPWYAGWGIRIGPDGWLFNVSGNRGIEIQTKDGSKYRIGSNEPERLDAHIKQKLAEGPGLG